ncbi:MAG: hypothetical protein HY704_12635 [Gemmatimonadetes bacterium]|nr:hypothetical protein [Gemmatimonadota bacterium]
MSGEPTYEPQPVHSDLGELVQRTAGLQPWRRVFHAGNGLVVAGALAAFPIARETALGLLGAALIVLFAADLVRLASPAANLLFFRTFAPLVSPREARRIASSTWYALGVWLAIALYPRQIAIASILALAVADPVAGYVGRRWGKRPLGRDGTLEGSAAFLLACALAFAPFTDPFRAALAAAATSGAERLPRILDDNVTIPLAAGAALWASALL